MLVVGEYSTKVLLLACSTLAARRSKRETLHLLPASLFHAVFVCNSDGYVVIDP